MKYLAIIPARGGSKGVVGKNLKELNGKPLIQWTIEQALSSQLLDRIVVSTDDAQIAALSRTLGAEVPFERPADLSGDHATTESAMLHTIDWLEQNQAYVPDALVLLQCTSPLRYSGAIDRSIAQYEQENNDSMLSVVPFWHFLWREKPEVNALYNYQQRPRRQDIAEDQIAYKENGSIYISSISGFRQTNNRLHGNIGLFKMAEEEGFEIDTLTDFAVLEALMKHDL